MLQCVIYNMAENCLIVTYFKFGTKVVILEQGIEPILRKLKSKLSVIH